MILMLGVYRTYFSIAESTLFANIRILGETIYFATIDRYLLKPVSTIFLASFEKVHIYDIFDGLLGIIFIVYALTHQHYEVSFVTMLLVLLVMLITTVLFASLILSVMSLAFRGSRVDNAYWIFDDLLKLSALPSQLHEGGWGIVLKFILPITLIASVPVEIIKGIFDYKLLVIYALITFAWMFIASRLWKDGLKRYTGAG
jgi:ABC-2 type transport system permease protein